MQNRGGIFCRFRVEELPLTLPINNTCLTNSSIERRNILSYITSVFEQTNYQVIIFDQPGFPATDFGCQEDDIVATFYDDAPNSAEDFENTCNAATPTIEGDFQSFLWRSLYRRI